MLTNATGRPVISLNEGEEGIIHSIAGGHALISRLAGMGIVLNTRIRFLRASGGLVIVQVADTRVALGASEAAKILVSRLPREEKGLRPQSASLLVALAGQPNAGKSTVFNILTGLSQHVGNWPGKTVEKKQGTYTAEGVELQIVDLPDMVVGAAKYTIDISVPGIKYASVERCPVMLGRFASYDATETLKVPGVERIVELAPPAKPVVSRCRSWALRRVKSCKNCPIWQRHVRRTKTRF